MRKRENETIPAGIENRMNSFSMSKKFTRITNGTNKYKTRPHVKKYKGPTNGYCDLYWKLIIENKKKWALFPFVD